MKVTIIYAASIELEVETSDQNPDREDIEDATLDEIESWPEELFKERLEILKVINVQF
jgi:hypothetical protein